MFHVLLLLHCCRVHAHQGNRLIATQERNRAHSWLLMNGSSFDHLLG
jgi:hypothetical protein